MKNNYEYLSSKECGTPLVEYQRRTKGLIVTHKCNLDCVYCYVEHKEDKTMSMEIAIEAVKDAFKDKEGIKFKEVEIDFLGGEPLCDFDRIKEIAQWIISVQWPKPYILFATTNGTLLNEDMKQWFREHKNKFFLGLSYDGKGTTQDSNRSNSSSQIDMNFFLETWPDQPVKMTISEETVSELADGVIYLHEKGFKVNANAAHGMKDWSDEAVSLYSSQLSKLIDYYVKNPEKPRVSLLDVDLTSLLNNNSSIQNKYCGAGVAFDVTDVDGVNYPCHMFSPLVLSKLKLRALKLIDYSSASDFEDSRCQKCVLKQICPTCYGMNFKYNSNHAARSPYICKLYRLQILANCKLQTKLLLGKENLSPKEKRIAYCINNIYKLLKFKAE